MSAELQLIRINWKNQSEHKDAIKRLFECPSIRKWFPSRVNPENVWKDWIRFSCDAATNQKSHSYLGYIGSELVGLSGVRSELIGRELRLEMDWHVKASYQGLGHGYRLARTAFENTLSSSIFRLIARIDPENSASNRLAQKIGMRKSESMWDNFVLWYTP